MAAGLGKTQAAAISGLFIDIGLASLPPELVSMAWSKMNDEQKKLYQTHPDLSVKLLMGKRMVVPPDVQKAILQHHERLDGNGFPDKLIGSKIAPLSQVVALADRFEALMFGSDKRPDVGDVMNQLRNENIIQVDLFNAVSALVRKERKAS
jgi:HD-GYP domain-containing protein (c-di-GMP phosphodiesterase class II)